MQVSSHIYNIIPPNHIKFKDKDTGENVEVVLEKKLKDKIETGTKDIEHYLQIMYAKYKEDGNIDENKDGYLDAKEFINSKRFATLDENKTEIVFSSLKKY